MATDNCTITSQAQFDSIGRVCAGAWNGALHVTNYTDTTLENSTLPSNIVSINISDSQTLKTISFPGMELLGPDPGNGVIGPNVNITNLPRLNEVSLGLRSSQNFYSMALQDLPALNMSNSFSESITIGQSLVVENVATDLVVSAESYPQSLRPVLQTTCTDVRITNSPIAPIVFGGSMHLPTTAFNITEPGNPPGFNISFSSITIIGALGVQGLLELQMPLIETVQGDMILDDLALSGAFSAPKLTTVEGDLNLSNINLEDEGTLQAEPPKPSNRWWFNEDRINSRTGLFHLRGSPSGSGTPSSGAPAPATPAPSSSSSTRNGEIVGGVLGSLLLISGFIAAMWFWKRRVDRIVVRPRRRRRQLVYWGRVEMEQAGGPVSTMVEASEDCICEAAEGRLRPRELDGVCTGCTSQVSIAQELDGAELRVEVG